MMPTLLTRNLEELKRDIIRVTLSVLLISVLMRTFEPYISNQDTNTHLIKTLLMDANSFYETSLQDSNSQIRYQHAVYAHAHLNIGRKLMNDSELERLTKFNIHELKHAIAKQEKNSQREIVRQCPKLKITPYHIPEPKSQLKSLRWPP